MAKLNKEQLKKLYDYGGTLSPKDWANMIDNLPENPIYNKDLLPVVKTTYEEVRELYNSGKMDPNVKYQFDYKYYNFYYDSMDDREQRAYFQDLIIYLDGGTVKAEYTGVRNINGDPITIDNVDVYDKSFTADFIFDSIITNSDYYEYIRPRYTFNTEYIISSMDDVEDFVKLLTENSIPHRVMIDEDSMVHIEFYNIAVTSDSEVEYHFVYNNHNIYYDTVDNTWSVENTAKYTTLAAIVNVKYDNGTFHKIFIDRYFKSDVEDYYHVSLTSLLMKINFYSGDLDTFIKYDDDLNWGKDHFEYGISFTDINYIMDAIEDDGADIVYVKDKLLIEIGGNVYYSSPLYF